jgi:Ca2+-binding EF-hand superfamily protein
MKKTFSMIAVTTIALASFASLAQAQKGILSLDTDGDGKVSSDEFRAPEDRRGPRLFERADADGDGVVSRDEMQSAVDAAEQKKQRMQSQMMERFDEMDADGNGMVTDAEAKAYAFQRADADGDGFVTEAEARAMHEQRKQMQKQRKSQQ